MNTQDRKRVGMAFWMGTIAFGGLVWAGLGILTNELVIAACVALVFCWVGGLLAQVTVDILRGRRSARFGRVIWRWFAKVIAYYIAAGFLFYWILKHVSGNWRNILSLAIMMFPLALLTRHLMAENARIRQQTENEANQSLHATSDSAAEPSSHEG